MNKPCLCPPEAFCEKCEPELWADHLASSQAFLQNLKAMEEQGPLPEPGKFFQHSEFPHISARVDEINTERGRVFILFSIRDRNHPEFGWSSGAALDPPTFRSVYPQEIDAEKLTGPPRIRLVATHDMIMPENLDFVSAGAAEALLKSAMQHNEVTYRWESIDE